MPLIILAQVILVTLAASSAQASPGAHADINGIKMYYELHGTGGVPLVLLHGGGSTIETTFGRALPLFARDRQVIGIEEQGHGRTSDRNAPFDFATSADDVAALLKHLKIKQADIFGFSNGASVAMQVAIRHPELVRKLVFASSMTKRSGAMPQLWTFMKDAKLDNMPQPLKDGFLKVNPDPKKLKNMHDKDAQRMLDFKDIPDSSVEAIRAQTLILAGDQDVTKPEHMVELTRLIPGARLMILPAGHGDYIGETTVPMRSERFRELTVEAIKEFLDAPTPR